MAPDQPNWQEMGITTGSDKQTEAVNEYDKRYGTYKDKVQDVVDVNDRLPTTQMPKAPDPAPFVTK